ncbi:hypothetical protein [Shewanella sp. MTB7]|uniref:hypothetical protein n=1 Tax=Shewanella sp. MTB7 TaxID=2746932 RepID=UPI0022BA3482|nr:hypothetical protein [Shewanella sp. MTB7]WBJ97153.1 hypothetical protein HWQ47_08655 [Shewanella sp. MTB7]
MMRIIFFLMSLLASSMAHAINVDKMVLVASDGQIDHITVMNPDTFPVFVRVELSELLSSGEEQVFNEQDFKHWPVFVDNDELIIDPNSRIKISINNLTHMLGNIQDKDRIIGISFIPESYQANNQSTKASLNILMGFKAWYVMPHGKDIVSGHADVIKNKKATININ